MLVLRLGGVPVAVVGWLYRMCPAKSVEKTHASGSVHRMRRLRNIGCTPVWTDAHSCISFVYRVYSGEAE